MAKSKFFISNFNKNDFELCFMMFLCSLFPNFAEQNRLQ